MPTTISIKLIYHDDRDLWLANKYPKVDLSNYKKDKVITNDYPFNPNGSIAGIASICSKNGRHLALMPHPERCFLKWQLPYMPDEISDKLSMKTSYFNKFVKNFSKYRIYTLICLFILILTISLLFL